MKFFYFSLNESGYFGFLPRYLERSIILLSHIGTVVGETLAVFSLPRIRKTCQCLDGQVDTTFSEIFGGNYNFLKFREAMNALFFNLESPTIEISICRHLVVKISILRNPFSRDFFDFWSFIRLG